MNLWRAFWQGAAIGAAIGILRNLTPILYCLGCFFWLIVLVALLIFWNYPEALVAIVLLIVVVRVLTKSKQRPAAPPGSPVVEPLPVEDPLALEPWPDPFAIEPAPPLDDPLAIEPRPDPFAIAPPPPSPRRKKWDGPYIPRRKRRPE